MHISSGGHFECNLLRNCSTLEQPAGHCASLPRLPAQNSRAPLAHRVHLAIASGLRRISCFGAQANDQIELKGAEQRIYPEPSDWVTSWDLLSRLLQGLLFESPASTLQFHQVCLHFEHQPKRHGAGLHNEQVGFQVFVAVLGSCLGLWHLWFQKSTLWRILSCAAHQHSGLLEPLLTRCTFATLLLCQSHPTLAQRHLVRAAPQPSLSCSLQKCCASRFS